jgi:hypothetical protein
MEQQAAAMGKPVVELERERRYIYSSPKTYDQPPAHRANQGKNNHQRKCCQKKKTLSVMNTCNT